MWRQPFAILSKKNSPWFTSYEIYVARGPGKCSILFHASNNMCYKRVLAVYGSISEIMILIVYYLCILRGINLSKKVGPKIVHSISFLKKFISKNRTKFYKI